MTYPLYSASPSFTPKVSISSLTKLKNHQKNILLHKKTVGPIDQRISQASIHDRKKKRRNYESWIRAGEASKRSEIELWSRAEAKTKLLSYFAFRPFLLCLVGILCLIKYLKVNIVATSVHENIDVVKTKRNLCYVITQQIAQ